MQAEILENQKRHVLNGPHNQKSANQLSVDDAESDRVKADSKVVENLGEIIVLIQGVTRGKLESPSNTTSAVKGAVTEVAEKALKGKALSHGVRQVKSSISKI
jgi:hypothetical protein